MLRILLLFVMRAELPLLVSLSWRWTANLLCDVAIIRRLRRVMRANATSASTFIGVTGK
jgi:hypothetical protein